jgi:hypothetical protein
MTVYLHIISSNDTQRHPTPNTQQKHQYQHNTNNTTTTNTSPLKCANRILSGDGGTILLLGSVLLGWCANFTI